MRRTAAGRWGAAVWLLCVLALCSGMATAAPRIGVVTMQPGEIFFERFGHNAIVVDDPALPEPLSYNFGFFDLDEPDFTANFIRGKMHYRLVALPLSQDLAYYRQVGRGVSIQWLDLPPDQARYLASTLAHTAQPEHARYRYDYFTDNCSTRVRDALDGALDGALQRQLQGRSRGNTYRGDAVRLASPAPWMWLGFDLGLGPSADRPNSLWQDAFVPMRLAEALRGLSLDDGRPLVAEEITLLQHRLPAEPAEAPRHWWPWLLAGLLVAAAILWAGHRARTPLSVVAIAFWATAGLAGALMLFIWLGTAHRFGWANHNLLLLNPLGLALIPGAWRGAHGRLPGRTFTALAWLLAGLAVLALFLHWLPVLPQRNLPWICLLLPIHLALASALAGRRHTRG